MCREMKNKRKATHGSIRRRSGVTGPLLLCTRAQVSVVLAAMVSLMAVTGVNAGNTTLPLLVHDTPNPSQAPAGWWSRADGQTAPDRLTLALVDAGAVQSPAAMSEPLSSVYRSARISEVNRANLAGLYGCDTVITGTATLAQNRVGWLGGVRARYDISADLIDVAANTVIARIEVVGAGYADSEEAAAQLAADDAATRIAAALRPAAGPAPSHEGALIVIHSSGSAGPFVAFRSRVLGLPVVDGVREIWAREGAVALAVDSADAESALRAIGALEGLADSDVVVRSMQRTGDIVEVRVGTPVADTDGW